MKSATRAGVGLTLRVAPFTGAWIEIKQETGRFFSHRTVAPFTGAWIEIK